MVAEDDKLVELPDVPEICAFFGLLQDYPTHSFTNPDGTGVSVLPDISHCMMLDPYWDEAADRITKVIERFESKAIQKNDLSQSLSNALSKK